MEGETKTEADRDRGDKEKEKSPVWWHFTGKFRVLFTCHFRSAALSQWITTWNSLSLVLPHCTCEVIWYCWHGMLNQSVKTLHNKYPCRWPPSLSLGWEASGRFVVQYGQSFEHSPRTSLLHVKTSLVKINGGGNGAWGPAIFSSQILNLKLWVNVSMQSFKGTFPVIIHQAGDQTQSLIHAKQTCTNGLYTSNPPVTSHHFSGIDFKWRR